MLCGVCRIGRPLFFVCFSIQPALSKAPIYHNSVPGKRNKFPQTKHNYDK